MTSTTMRAVVLRAAGGPEQLVLEQITTPAPGPDEALVRVHAAALTRDELEWPVDRLPAIPSSAKHSNLSLQKRELFHEGFVAKITRVIVGQRHGVK